MIFERLQVIVRPGVVGRPDKSDCTFLFRGKPWTKTTISPSATSTWQQCQHKWGLYAIEKEPRTEKKSQAIGLEAHESLEHWLTSRATPKWRRLLDSGALEHFPAPMSEGLQVEQVFAFAFSPTDNEEEAVVYWGFKDAEQGTTVYDLKTTSDLSWAKTREELREDVQANVYAADNLLRTGEDFAACRWVYCQTRGKITSDPREVLLSRDAVIMRLLSLHEASLTMTMIREDKSIRAADLPRDETSCGDYGGCDYLHLCQDHLSKASGSRFSALHRQSAQAAERKQKEQAMSNLSVLERVDALIAARGGKPPAATPASVPVSQAATRQVAAAPAAQAAPTPVTPAPPRAAPTPVAPAPPKAAPPKAAPASISHLANVLQRVSVPSAPAAAAPAQGVNPPDAPPPSADATEALADAQDEAPDEGALDEAEVTPAAAAPPPPAAAPPPPPAKPRTRRAAAPVPAQEAPERPAIVQVDPRAAPLMAPIVPAPAPAVGIGGFVLFVDVRPLRAVQLAGVRDIEEILAPSRAKVEAEAKAPVGAIDYGKGPAIFGAQLEEDYAAAKPQGIFLVSSKAVHPTVLEVLIRLADAVWGKD